MNDAQRAAIKNRDVLGLIAAGGNVYYLAKFAGIFGLSVQDLGALQTGMAAPFIDSMPERYNTQLGRWFKGGRELSGGQWQKIALSRAFMRSEADILVLDEPTAAMDAAAEAHVFELFREESKNKMTILISHRFSTVRAADQIVITSYSIHYTKLYEL